MDFLTDKSESPSTATAPLYQTTGADTSRFRPPIDLTGLLLLGILAGALLLHLKRGNRGR